MSENPNGMTDSHGIVNQSKVLQMHFGRCNHKRAARNAGDPRRCLVDVTRRRGSRQNLSTLCKVHCSSWRVLVLFLAVVWDPEDGVSLVDDTTVKAMRCPILNQLTSIREQSGPCRERVGGGVKSAKDKVPRGSYVCLCMLEIGSGSWCWQRHTRLGVPCEPNAQKSPLRGRRNGDIES